jgi:hypothetical protein
MQSYLHGPPAFIGLYEIGLQLSAWGSKGWGFVGECVLRKNADAAFVKKLSDELA